MRIKLLAVDLDGTLLNSNYKIGEKDFQAVQQAKALGVIVVLVTGRRFRVAAPYAQELGLDSPIVVHNGALIKAPSTGEVVFFCPLPLSECRGVIELARENNLDPVVTIHPEGFGKLVIDLVDQNNTRLVKYLWLSSEDLLKVDDLLGFLREDPIQVTFSDNPEKVGNLSAVLKSRLNGSVKVLETIYLKRNLTILDVAHPNVSKGAALSYLSSLYGIQPEEVLAIGDNFNDLDMLKFAGTGVVMKNADEKLKTMGFDVTLSNDEGGVGEAIRRYIL